MEQEWVDTPSQTENTLKCCHSQQESTNGARGHSFNNVTILQRK